MNKTAIRELYKQYMQNKHYSKHTIDQYTGYYMNRLYKQTKIHMPSLMGKYSSIYEITDLNVLKSIYAHISKLPEFKRANVKYSGGINATYCLYVNFFESNLMLAFSRGFSSNPKTQMKSNPDAPNINKKNTIKQIPFSVSTVINTIRETGLVYTPNLIKRLIFSLISKRFLILSGLAGSGKTQLAIAFASSLVLDKEKQMCVVSVGADWTNREPLLGYPNALQQGKYVKPENGVLDLLIEANKTENADKPFFLILDEMNMSYVERYFADFLSAMESKEKISLWNTDVSDKKKVDIDGVPQRIGLPRNLFIIGTINVDETTYMFSPKVLDRANVIEFKISPEDMASFLTEMREVDREIINGKISEMGADFVEKSCKKDFDKDDKAKLTLQEFFNELKNVNAEFGYRSATEIFRFICQAKTNDDTKTKMTDEEILDAAIVQKLLPKLHGSRKKLEPVLTQLWKLCFIGANKDLNISRENVAKAKFKESADKIYRMFESAIANGFTSYAEA